AERSTKACGKDDQPDQWPYESREEPLALLQEAEKFPPDDAIEGADMVHHAAMSCSVSPPISSLKAPPRSPAPVSATTSFVLPRARMRPRVSTSKSSSASTSSKRWVAHSTPILSARASS